MNKHPASILQALFVTFLWSTSFIIIKKGLGDIPPVTFAGLRYSVASLSLLSLLFRKNYRNEIRSLNMKQWMKLMLLGFVYYALTQGIQFIGLSLLSSATVSLMLNFTPIIVVVLASAFLNEKPNIRQISGIVFFIAGATVFFLPLSGISSQLLGLIIMSLGVVSNSVSSVIGRQINKTRDISPFTVTLVSMSFGSVILLAAGIITEGFPEVSVVSWSYILWLALINTAFAFTLWNHTLRSLSAMESSIINGTMLIQIAILAWVFLGERLSLMKIIGMAIASVGAILVQIKSKAGKSTAQM